MLMKSHWLFLSSRLRLSHGDVVTFTKVRTCFAEGREDSDFSPEHCFRFVTAIIDPDWPYTAAPGKATFVNDESGGKLSGYTRNKDGKNIYKRKKALSVGDLKLLPVGKIVGGYVFLWTVGPFLINDAATEILDAWGFEPVSIITWAKYNVKDEHGYGGVGFWFLGNAEFCIVAKRKGWPSIRTGRSSLLIAPKTKHSEKSDDVHELCESRFPGPYLELFARKEREGWTVLGDEIDGRDLRDSLKELIHAGLLQSPK